MNHVTIWTLLPVIFTFAHTADACFPGNTWINCLLNTCTIYKKCPGDPSATCTIKRTECGCEANWYKPSGKIANCDVRKNREGCPGGKRIVPCKVDLCKWSCNHQDFMKAPCRQTNCGQCLAEYFVKEKWVSCPAIVQGKGSEILPTSSVISHKDQGICRPVKCNIKICINEKCPMEPRAVCRPDGCNECKPAWYLDDVRVQCHTAGRPIVPSRTPVLIEQSACAPGIKYVPCDHSVCDKQFCRNYPNAVCSSDGCGECKAVWLVEGKRVDCLNEVCSPKVPFVKCVDDPCKYFAHYCPHAECRATQCGQCKAKFFSNGVEIDCAMPAKTCPAGVKPLNCQWFTCPSNICPSNERLMCRIDPCGRACRHDWVDIYNGEVMTCRTFDGDGRTMKTDRKSEKIFMKDPLSKFFDSMKSGKSAVKDNTPRTVLKTIPEPQHPISIITGNVIQGTNQNIPEVKTKADVIVSRGPGRFRVEPIFVQPRQIMSQEDLYAMLNAFDHELVGISSMSIQNALKQDQVLPSPASKSDLPKQQKQPKVILPRSQQVKQSSPTGGPTAIGSAQTAEHQSIIGHKPQDQHNPDFQTQPFSDHLQVISASIPFFNPGNVVQNANFLQENTNSGEIKQQPMNAETVLPRKTNDVTALTNDVLKKDKQVVPVDQMIQNQDQVVTDTTQPGKPDPIWLLPVDPSQASAQPGLEVTMPEIVTGTKSNSPGVGSPIWLLFQDTNPELGHQDKSPNLGLRDTNPHLGQKGGPKVVHQIPRIPGTINTLPGVLSKASDETSAMVKPLGTPSHVLKEQVAPELTKDATNSASGRLGNLKPSPIILPHNSPPGQIKNFIAAGDGLKTKALKKPKRKGGNMGGKSAPKTAFKPKRLGPKKVAQRNKGKGVPLSMHIFQQWAA